MTGRVITLSASDGGEFSAYIALPNVDTGPGIVMLQEIFGVTAWIKETADMFAQRGYCVAAPEIFSRLERDFVADHNDPEQVKKGLRYRGLLDHELAVADIASVIAKLNALPQCNGKFGVIGFCLGGTLAYLAAARLEIDAAVAYYGTQIHEFLEEGANIQCETLLHMGNADAHVPRDLAEKIIAALKPNPNIAIDIHAAGHAFANTHRTASYSSDVSQVAHARTFEIFDRLR